MLLNPKFIKYRKLQKKSTNGPTSKNILLSHNFSFGLKALESFWITAKQLEAARKTITHCTKRTGKILLRIFPDKSLTVRSKESRMGSGKGSVDHWVANARPNSIIFELYNIPTSIGLKALVAAKAKLPLKTEIVSS